MRAGNARAECHRLGAELVQLYDGGPSGSCDEPNQALVADLSALITVFFIFYF
jgi:hypothetical protein